MFTNGISIFGGLLHFNYYTLVFNLFIVIITVIILGLISFFPLKFVIHNKYADNIINISLKNKKEA
jgi:hypothetical protein